VGETGKSLDVTVSGFGFDGNTKVLMYPDIGNTKAIIGSVDLGVVRNVAISGTTAYVADLHGGLQIIDVSDPAKPQIIGSVDTPGEAFDIALSGTTAYVADYGSGLQLIDVSDPAKVQGSLDTPGLTSGVAVSGTTAYMADYGSGLQIIDIKDPANPKIIGSVDTPGRAYTNSLSKIGLSYRTAVFQTAETA